MFDSDYRPMVTIKKIKKIAEHTNADALELAFVDGWQVIVKKDSLEEGDLVLYFEIDSVLPKEIEERIFPSDSKITLSKSRVKTIKIRGMYSQGLIVPIDLFSDYKFKAKESEDVTKVLGVKKYEEPIKKGNLLYVQPKKKKFENPNFKKVRKPDNIKYNPDLFIGKKVSITEKLHGTSFVAGYVKRPNFTITDKIRIWLFGEYEFVFRSMNVQIQRHDSIWNGFLKKLRIKKDTGFYQQTIKKNVYQEAVEKYDLKNRLKPGFEITGEIIGDGIQKGYTYGCGQNERKLVCFGVRYNGENISFHDAFDFVQYIGLEYAPVLFEGVLTKEVLDSCTNGKSVYCSSQKKEGCVVECLEENVYPSILKSISEAYLMQKDLTDFH